MEKGQRKQEPLEIAGLGALIIGLILEVAVGSGQIGLEPSGRLVGELDAGLQDGHREPVGGHGSEPEPVVRVRVGLDLELLYPLELGEPGNGQVAVLQHDPAAVSPAGLDVLLGDVALALAERELGHPAALHLLLLGELVEVGHGVRAGREHENDGRHAGGVEEGVREVELRVRGEGVAQVLLHVVADQDDQFLLPEGLQQDQLLEHVEPRFERAGQRFFPGVLGLHELLEVF